MVKKALCILGLGLLPVLALVSAQGPILSIQNEFHEAKQLYAMALDKSRLELSELSHTLRGDSSLVQSLSGEGLNAVSRSLSGYVKPGSLDYIAILDQNCRIVAHSEQGQPLSPACPIDNFNPLAPAHFQWRAASDLPRLELVAPLGGSFTLLLATALSDKWIASHPQLKEAFRTRDIRLGHPSGSVILEEGRNKDQIAIASLTSNDPWLKVVPQLLNDRSIALQKPIGAALLLFLGALAYLIQRMRRREQEFKAAHAALADWAQDLAPEHEPKPSGPMAPRKQIQSIQERLTRLAKSNFEQIQRFQHQNHMLQQQTVTLESRLMEHQAQQAWFHQVRSLHEQMMACAGAHMSKLNESYSLGEDLSHLAARQLARPAQKLADLSSRWEAELRQMSARKFVRSLSERIDVDGTSELEQSLNFILEQSHELSNNAINLTVLSQKLLVDLRANLQLAEHWHHMMGGHEANKLNLVKQVTSGQALIQLQDASLSVHYDNLIDPETDLTHLDILPSTLTSALYHCYLALIESARIHGGSELQVMSQLKKRSGKAILVLSVKAEGFDDFTESSQLPPKADQHLYLAIQLVQSYPLRIGQLPGIHGLQAITLMWDESPAPAKKGDMTLAPTLDL